MAKAGPLEAVVGGDESERAKVFGWRLQILIEAGFPIPEAEEIARSGVDLHRAVDLVTKQGCSSETATRILL